MQKKKKDDVYDTERRRTRWFYYRTARNGKSFKGSPKQLGTANNFLLVVAGITKICNVHASLSSYRHYGTLSVVPDVIWIRSAYNPSEKCGLITRIGAQISFVFFAKDLQIFYYSWYCIAPKNLITLQTNFMPIITE